MGKRLIVSPSYLRPSEGFASQVRDPQWGSGAVLVSRGCVGSVSSPAVWFLGDGFLALIHAHFYTLSTSNFAVFSSFQCLRQALPLSS